MLEGSSQISCAGSGKRAHVTDEYLPDIWLSHCRSDIRNTNTRSRCTSSARGRSERAKLKYRETLNAKFAQLHRALANGPLKASIGGVTEEQPIGNKKRNRREKSQILLHAVAHIRDTQAKVRRMKKEIEGLRQILRHLEHYHLGVIDSHCNLDDMKPCIENPSKFK